MENRDRLPFASEALTSKAEGAYPPGRRVHAWLTPPRGEILPNCTICDELSGTKEMGEEYGWHDRYMHNPTQRIVRVEVVAQVRM